MATNRNDEGGYKRGAKGIDGTKGCNVLHTERDNYMNTAGPHEIDYVMKSIGVNVADDGLLDSHKYNDNQWASGGLPRGGRDRQKAGGDFGTSPSIQRVKPRGKYAKTGGTGKGFGE